jgi:RNA polymerase sigma-70 factor (ECF subfamily)
LTVLNLVITLRKFTKMKTNTLKQQEIENLFKEFFSELLAYMHKFTSNFTHAQESAQHSFTKLAKGKYSFKNLDTTKAWLKVVARNCLYTYYKRNNRYLLCEHSEFVSEDNNFKLIENSNGFNILVQSEEEASVKLDIKNSLNKLSKKQKEVITLRYFENLSYEEIAKKTKNKVTNVGFLINEAKNNLKKHLSNRAKI